MTRPNLPLLLQCRDLCDTLLMFCECPTIYAISGTDHGAHRACFSSRTLWKRLCIRDFPNTRWQLFDQHSHARFSTTYRICANQECYEHCALCDKKLWKDEPAEPRFLLMCPCLRMPQYIVAHATCLPDQITTTDEVREIQQQRPRHHNTLRNSAAIARRHVRNYRCPFCHQTRSALTLRVYSY